MCCSGTLLTARGSCMGEDLLVRRAAERFQVSHTTAKRWGWSTHEELRIAIVTWIERTYHRRRRQAALGRLTPIEYELISENDTIPAAG